VTRRGKSEVPVVTDPRHLAAAVESLGSCRVGQPVWPRDERGDDALGADLRAGARRPYSGQRHTIHGARGRRELRGLTVRDVGDAVVTVLAQARRTGELGERMDDEAFAQNVAVTLEHMLGIYPNVDGDK